MAETVTREDSAGVAVGALLAWRGFALHDRLGRFDETLPLPALASLAPDGPFSEQDPRGSQAFVDFAKEMVDRLAAMRPAIGMSEPLRPRG